MSLKIEENELKKLKSELLEYLDLKIKEEDLKTNHKNMDNLIHSLRSIRVTGRLGLERIDFKKLSIEIKEQLSNILTPKECCEYCSFLDLFFSKVDELEKANTLSLKADQKYAPLLKKLSKLSMNDRDKLPLRYRFICLYHFNTIDLFAFLNFLDKKGIKYTKFSARICFSLERKLSRNEIEELQSVVSLENIDYYMKTSYIDISSLPMMKKDMLLMMKAIA